MDQKYLYDLNNQQYKAATTIDGNLLILAGAGSGKTKTMVARTAYMLEENINPESILLLTFTNKAANEMKNRIHKLIGNDNADKITACTFHSFCAALLRKHAELIGFSRNYSILDSIDAMDVMGLAKQEFLQEAKKKGIEYNYKDFPRTEEVMEIYECSVNKCITYEEVIDKSQYREEILSILKRYKKYKKDRNFMDYDDLLYFTEKLLSHDEYLRSQVDKAYQYIMCDEFQDTNIVQDRILELISRDYTNLAVVGDDNQSIYAFRYAEIDNILTFNERHPDCKNIVLKTNYRSSQEILDVANAMMEYAEEGIQKHLDGLFHGDIPKLVITDDCYEEADYIMDYIRHYEGSRKDIAIICRSAMQSYILEQMLTLQGISYNKFGGIKFLEKVVIRDILSFLRVSVNEKDELALFRILQLYPGIGKVYAKRIAESIIQTDFLTAIDKYKKQKYGIYLQELYEAVEQIKKIGLNPQLKYLIENYYKKVRNRTIDLSNAEQENKLSAKIVLELDLADAKNLYILSERYMTTEAFLNDIVLDATSMTENNEEKITITTIHSAKGLEFETVFILDCIDGVTPRCNRHDKENAEELRCMYVAVTRAKKELYLMTPAYYNIKQIKGTLSHFLNEKDILETLDIQGYLPRVRKTIYDF